MSAEYALRRRLLNLIATASSVDGSVSLRFRRWLSERYPEIAVHADRRLENWSEWQDLNLRPSRPERRSSCVEA
jgi:hypothetical protein